MRYQVAIDGYGTVSWGKGTGDNVLLFTETEDGETFLTLTLSQPEFQKILRAIRLVQEDLEDAEGLA